MMSDPNGIPLHQVPGWTEDLVKRLAENWITTAEQVLAACATPEGFRAMAAHLEVSEDAMLAPHSVHRLETPVDTSNFGLGVRKPDK
jgi:hypothetical protein